MREKISGVYKITNTVNGMVYVGSSCDVLKRWTDHRGELRSGRHHNDKLKKAWNKYGESAFTFELLERCSVTDIRTREELWIAVLHAASRKHGYNLAACTDSPNRGRKMSLESRMKMSKAGKGKKKPCSAEHRAAIKEVWKTRRLTPVSEETRARMSAAHKGVPRPASFVEKMTGRVKSSNERLNLGLAAKRALAEGRHNFQRCRKSTAHEKPPAPE